MVLSTAKREKDHCKDDVVPSTAKREKDHRGDDVVATTRIKVKMSRFAERSLNGKNWIEVSA